MEIPIFTNKSRNQGELVHKFIVVLFSHAISLIYLIKSNIPENEGDLAN